MSYLLDVDGREGGNNREPNSSNSSNISGPFTLSVSSDREEPGAKLARGIQHSELSLISKQAREELD